ncbi:MAG: hypothetical protein JWQ06_1955 [Mucilaginibacter sp.]|nr:hypothetical protein [Mucilaginibacter sp.]
MVCKETLYSDHAITQMFKRNISVDNIRLVIENGEVIMTYLYDKPYPSYLILGYINSRPIHVVLGKSDNLDRCIVITAYEPDENIWETDYKSKKD